MGSKYTVEQQANRLPSALRDLYRTTTIDRIQVDGNEFSGYFEYSFIEEKTYFLSPERSQGGVIDNLNSYASCLTPHLVIKYNYMGIEDYRRLMTLLNSKNEFTVNLYDIVANKRVTHKMYFATPSMPNIHQQYLQALGVLDYTIELIGTNSDVEEYTITYTYNYPTGYSGTPTSSTVETARNVSIVVQPSGTEFSNGYVVVNGSTYDLQYWLDESNGLKYINGESYFFNDNKTLKAIWALRS